MTNLRFNFNQKKIKLRSKIFSAFLAVLPQNLQQKKLIINIHLIDEKKIKKLNFQFRQCDQPTDVLSFPLNLQQSLPQDAPTELGDIFICPAIASKKQHSLHFLLIHGFLHLLDLDHQTSLTEKKWKNQEKKIFSLIGLSFPG